jgi:hypothetical protein
VLFFFTKKFLKHDNRRAQCAALIGSSNALMGLLQLQKNICAAKREWESVTQAAYRQGRGGYWHEFRSKDGASAWLDWLGSECNLIKIESKGFVSKAGTRLLNEIVGICKKHSVSIVAMVNPYNPSDLDEEPTAQQIERLKQWYIKAGFDVCNRTARFTP